MKRCPQCISYRTRSSGAAIQSIAGMPFVNASGNQDLEYLSDDQKRLSDFRRKAFQFLWQSHPVTVRFLSQSAEALWC